MINQIVIHRVRDTSSLRHGGPRTYRNFRLIVNGKVWETYMDDSTSTNWASGPYLDKIILAEAEKIQKFFGGTIMYSRLKDTSELEEQL